jgi:UDP-sugar pyrophosphorylase
MATETKYIQYYIEYILAVQKKYANGKRLPLCIMTSGDTNAGTVKLLKENHYFGMDEDQFTLVQQGQGVPALTDNNATIALESPSKVSTKPHGHGDVHSLLFTHKVAKKWVDNGIEWIAFFQDTNGLAFHTLPLALGVSTKFDLVMNSLAVPRKAKQAIGGISKLVNDKGEERYVNIRCDCVIVCCCPEETKHPRM